jgi:hypothetical protein
VTFDSETTAGFETQAHCSSGRQQGEVRPLQTGLVWAMAAQLLSTSWLAFIVESPASFQSIDFQHLAALTRTMENDSGQNYFLCSAIYSLSSAVNELAWGRVGPLVFATPKVS